MLWNKYSSSVNKVNHRKKKAILGKTSLLGGVLDGISVDLGLYQAGHQFGGDLLSL